MVRVIHAAVKGRARYKVHGLYRSESLKRHLELGLLKKQGICHVSANILTGNVLVVFNSDNHLPEITTLIEELALEHKKQNKEFGVKVDLHASLYKEGKHTGSSLLKTRNPRTSRGALRKLISRTEGQRLEPWHFMETDSVLASFNTSSVSGLSSESAKENLKTYGPNLLPESVPRSGLSIFMDQLKSLPLALLAAAAGISILTGGIADALVIMGVVVINAAIGYTTESQSEKILHSLKSFVRPSALVVRDGSLKEIKSEEVVPGDILVLRPGSYIVADARLIEANHLSVDESALTGESMPVIKTSGSVPDQKHVPLADRANMVYMGTLVTGGQGLAVVVATGKFTEMGRIQTLIEEEKPPETPMERQLSRLGSQLVLVGSAVCGIVFVIGLLRGYRFIQMLKTSISLAVAAVPEGLPTVATTTLALGIKNMRRCHVLIRHLDAVETLGSVQTLCLDKTGTITLNKMSVVAIYTGMRRIKIFNGQFIAGEEDIDPFTCDELLRLIQVSALCSETEISRQDGEYVLRGSPTENALLHLAISSGVDVIKLREDHPVLKLNHRSESHNLMSTLHVTHGQQRFLAVKGSPTEVLSLCNWHIKDGKKIPLTEGDRLSIETENERMAGEALRVLGTAYAYVQDGEGSFNGREDLIWLGLIGMADPIREGVKEAISVFHQAGIDTVMITGDQSPTAYAIGKELDLSRGEQLEILDSTHLAKVDSDVLKALSKRVHVFARVSPAHKLRIVQALQKAGKVVGMTGDGINDGPALKAADIGIAMGHTGTDVAREVADMVLEEDNLETMILAISHGRTLHHNIRKTVHFLLATNLSEILVTFTAITMGLGHPLNAMQLLWINLISDIFPGLALALEPPEPDVLSQPPRDPEEPIIKTSDFKRITFESAMLSAGTLGSYGYGIMRYGVGPRASTLAFMSLATGQLLHAMSCRSDRQSLFDEEKLPPNKYLNVALVGAFALQVLSLAVPGLRNLLGMTPIRVLDGLVIGSSALLPLVINEKTKSRG